MPGYLHSHVMGTSPAEGHGAELSVMVFPADWPVSLGAFGQWQRYNGDHTRLAGGIQATFLWPGVELGWARREAAFGAPRAAGESGPDTRTWEAATGGLHVAPFLSLGFVSFAYRWTIPFGQATGPAHGAEHAFTVAVKIPLQILGPSIYTAVARGMAAIGAMP
jgi:hypothetical protein